MTNYEKKKSRVRDEAIREQLKMIEEGNEEGVSLNELQGFNEKFIKLGKRYGLLKEFRENGVM